MFNFCLIVANLLIYILIVRINCLQSRVDDFNQLMQQSVHSNVVTKTTTSHALNDLCVSLKRANMSTSTELQSNSQLCAEIAHNYLAAARARRRSINVTPSQSLQYKWQRVLSRPKRYLSFPEGSSFSVAVCFTVGIIGNPRFNYMSFGLNWGVAYDLPNVTWVLNHLHGFSRHPVAPAVLRRRARRSVYKDIEIIVDNMGFNGRDCLMRALCESRQYFQRTKMGMIGEMLRVIFSLPKQRLFTRELHENADIVHYDRAYRQAHGINCERTYECGFSLLELALGKYSVPNEAYYGAK